MTDLRVAIIHPGNRVEKMYYPLQAAGVDVALEPPDRAGFDILLVDNADRELGGEVLRRPFSDGRLVYRMRGDIFHELKLWEMPGYKKWTARNAVLPYVGGCIAVTDWMAEKFQRKTGVSPVGAAGLPKRVDDWPAVDHTWDELRLTTLTNANYLRKIQAIIDWAPSVERVLADTGGWWAVCGKGKYAGHLREALVEFDHVKMLGYVDAGQQLGKSNAMVHLSYLDGQPNSVLEGLASGLPVLTNEFKAFRHFDGPIQVCDGPDELGKQLRGLTDPDERERWGAKGREYVRANHNRAAIGEQYVEYFQELLQA
jgi:hypothetical protein